MRTGISAFVVVDDRGPPVAGQFVSGCVELSLCEETQIASGSVGLACHVGRPLSLPERSIPADEWTHVQPLDVPDVLRADARIPFSFRLPFAPILTVEPILVQPLIAAQIVTRNGSSCFGSAPLQVEAAPLKALAECMAGDPYRTSTPHDIELSRIRRSELEQILRGRPECSPLLSSLAELDGSFPTSLRGLTLSPPSITALGEEIVVVGRHRTQPDHDRVWWSLCCRKARASAAHAREGDVVCRIEPRRVVPVDVGSRDVQFHLPVPRCGPPSFASAEWTLRWSLVADVTTPQKAFVLEIPLVVLPFVHPRSGRNTSPPSWLKGKLAHVLRRIQAAKVPPR